MKKIRRYEVEQDSEGKAIYEVVEELQDNESDEITSSLRKTFHRCPNCGTPLKDAQAVRGTCAVCQETATCMVCEARCVCGRALCSACRRTFATPARSVLCCPECLRLFERSEAEQHVRELLRYRMDKLVELQRLKIRLTGLNTRKPEGGIDLPNHVRLLRLTREIEQLQQALVEERPHE